MTLLLSTITSSAMMDLSELWRETAELSRINYKTEPQSESATRVDSKTFRKQQQTNESSP